MGEPGIRRSGDAPERPAGSHADASPGLLVRFRKRKDAAYPIGCDPDIAAGACTGPSASIPGAVNNTLKGEQPMDGATIPHNVDGETDRQSPPAADSRALVPYRAPESARQEALCDIFAKVLGTPRFGIDDDFFDLGGRSVDAVLLASRINATIGVTMRMMDLFDTPTVAELDQRLSEREAEAR
jgi:hypothetical protein